MDTPHKQAEGEGVWLGFPSSMMAYKQLLRSISTAATQHIDNSSAVRGLLLLKEDQL